MLIHFPEDGRDHDDDTFLPQTAILILQNAPTLEPAAQTGAQFKLARALIGRQIAQRSQSLHAVHTQRHTGMCGSLICVVTVVKHSGSL